MDYELEGSRLAAALVTGASDLEDQLDPSALLQSFADLLIRATPHFPLAWFYIGDPRAHRVAPQYCAGPESAYGRSLVIDRSALMMRGPVRRALESGEPVVQSIPRQLPAAALIFPGVRDWHRRALQAGVRSVLALPFALSDSSEWGLTVVYADTSDYFDAVGLKPFDALGRLVRVGLDRVALREAEQRTRADLERARTEDPVTGLPNQAGFEVQWRGVAQSPGLANLLINLDIDDFAALNAGMGHTGGDRVLQAVAERLRSCIGEYDVVGRAGADEFLIGTTAADDSAAAERVEALQAAIARNLRVDGRDLALSASAGYVVAYGDTLPTPHQAAIAQRQARAVGQGSRQAYRAATGTELEAPQDLLGQIRHAIDSDELALFYQPQVDVQQPGIVVGAEALIRWRRRDGSLVPPGAFIPAVEGSAMIRDIGCWVLWQAARHLHQWGSFGPPVVGVNIGGRHLLHPRFLEDIDAVLSRYPAVAGRLSIEVTETAAITDQAATHRALVALRSRGLSIALDDFGTGFASFSQLASLPVDQIKIDRQFVDGLDHSPRQLALVESLLTVAAGLDLGVVAEGIETADEGEVLASIGCRVGQGYAYAHPADESSFSAWLNDYRTASVTGVPMSQPVIGAVCRVLATLRSAEVGDGLSGYPAFPEWFPPLFDNDPQAQVAMDALADYRDHLGPDNLPPRAVRGAALQALEALQYQLRSRLVPRA